METLPFFSNNDISKCLNYDELIPLMSDALADYSKQNGTDIIQPPRTRMELDERENSSYTIMSASSIKTNALVAKVITKCPRQSPPGYKLLLLLELQSGKPLCVRVWSQNFQNTKEFADTHECVPCENVEEAVQNADVIVTATTSKTPVLDARWVKKGALINCIGAVVNNWHELDPALMKISDVYVDTKEEALKMSGDIIMSGVDIKGEVGELILRTKTADRNTTTVFKSMGMAVEDVMCSTLIYKKIVGELRMSRVTKTELDAK